MAGPGILSFSRTDKYCSKLADEIVKLRGEKALMDFKIHVKDDEFPCAKFVMAAHSPMLRAVLTSDMAEVAKQEIRLDHISKDIIQIILDYMYCEDVSFNKDELMALTAAADYLRMTELKQMCLDEVPDILEPGNVIQWWKEAGKMKYNTIKEQCEEIMTANFSDISQQTDFLNLELNEMQHYLNVICSDTVNSDDIVDATMRWVRHVEERVSLLEDLLHKVNLSKCTDERIKAVMNSYEELLDKMPMVYKLLLKTSSDIRADTYKRLNDSVAVVGGQEVNTNKVNPVCWLVNHSKGIVHLCDIPLENLGIRFSVCKIPQGFAISGGLGTCLCMLFITSTKSWIRLQNLLEERRLHGSAFVKEVLYVLGGYLGKYTNDSKPSDSVQLMVMKDGEWKNGPNMPVGIQCPRVSNLDDDVYLLDEVTNQLLHLDVHEQVWSHLASLSEENEYCAGVSMTSAQGRLFVAGGENMICAWYHPKTNTWCTGQQPLAKHIYGALAYHDDTLLLLGGNFSGGTDDIEKYNIEENKWSVCNYKMPKKTYFHHAVVVNVEPCD